MAYLHSTIRYIECSARATAERTGIPISGGEGAESLPVTGNIERGWA